MRVHEPVAIFGGVIEQLIQILHGSMATSQQVLLQSLELAEAISIGLGIGQSIADAMKTTAILGGVSVVGAFTLAAHHNFARVTNGTANGAVYIPLRNNIGDYPISSMVESAHMSLKDHDVIYLMTKNHSFDNIASYWDFRDD